MGSIFDMLDGSSLEHNAILDAFTYQPWQVDGSIDTNRGKFVRTVNPRRQAIFRDMLKLGIVRI